MSKVSLKEKLLANGWAHLYLEYRLNRQREKQLLGLYVNCQNKQSKASSLRNRFKISIEAFEHQLNHGQIDHTFPVLGLFFVVF